MSIRIKNNLKLYCYVSLALIWISIGSNPKDISYLFHNIEDFFSTENSVNYFKNFVNFFRAIIPILLIPLSIFFIKKFKIYKNIDRGYKIVILLLISQLISTIYSNYTEIVLYETKLEYLGRFYWIISAFSTIFIFLIFDRIEKGMNKLLYISIFFILCVVIFFSIKYLLDFYSSNTSIYNMNFRRESGFFLNHEIPRVTGLSRSIIILFLFIIFFFLFKFSFNGLIKILYISILLSLIFLFQTKFGLLFLIISCGIYIFFQKERLKSTAGITLLLSVSILLAVLTSYSRVTLDIKLSPENSINKPKTSEPEKQIRHFRSFNMSDGITEVDKSLLIFLGGRHNLWISSLNFIKEEPILGYGAISDRVLLNTNDEWLFMFEPTLGKQNNPVSNALFYSLISGGLISAIILVYLYFFIFKKLLTNTLNKTYLSRENSFYYAILVMLVLRSLIENSFMIFGIDYIFLLHVLKIRN